MISPPLRHPWIPLAHDHTFASMQLVLPPSSELGYFINELHFPSTNAVRQLLQQHKIPAT